MKQCRRCRQIKPLRFFHVRRASSDGRRSYCASCACAAEKARRLANPEKVKASASASYRRNRLSRAATQRRWRERNRRRHRELARIAYRNNRAAYIARAAEWNAAHPEMRSEERARRRARLKGQTVGRVDYVAILARHGPVCHLCGLSIAVGELEFDHVIPLARGGQHSADNVRPSHSRCNRAKGSRLPHELSTHAA